jgi:hypothetical protein
LHRRKPSLARALRRSFGWTFFIAALYKFAYDSLLFVGTRRGRKGGGEKEMSRGGMDKGRKEIY